MPRLPQVGQDNNEWGTILNEYLEVEHNSDGTQKTFTETISRTIYISTTGNDTTGDGTSSFPYLTPTKALSTIKRIIGSGVTITVSIGEGNFDLTLEDLNTLSLFSGPGKLWLQGTQTLVDSGFSIGSAEVNDPFTYAVSGGNTASWSTDQWKYYFLKSGSNYFPITHNTSTTISLASNNVTGTEIYQNVTVINVDSEKIEFNMNFNLYYLHIVLNSTLTYIATTYSPYNFIHGCHISSSINKTLQCADFKAGFVRYNSFQNLRILACDNPIFNYSYVFYNGTNSALEKRNKGSRNIVVENPNTTSNASALVGSGEFSIWNTYYLKVVNSNVVFLQYYQSRTFFYISNLICVNNNYIFRKLLGYGDVPGAFVINNLIGNPNTRYFYESINEFVNPATGNNLQITGIIYPEHESNLSSTLTDATATNVVIGDKLQNRSIIIDYTITRGTTFEAGRLRVVHNGTTLSLTEDIPTGDDVGVSFAVAFNTNEIQIQCTLTSTGTSATMKYNATRVMITPLTI